MANSTKSELAKLGDSQVISHPQPATSIGLNIPTKLTRENFLLWKTQLFLLLNCYDLAHILMQEPPIPTKLDTQGEITVNPTYQAWWRQDQQVFSLIVSSLS